jgi:hypothetical protein
MSRPRVLPLLLAQTSPARRALLGRSLAAALLAALPALAGCIYAGGTTVREMGPQLSQSALAPVEPGKTTVEWVVAAFGAPTSRNSTSEGAEILRYDGERRTTRGAYFLGLFASSDNTIERTSWWFEARDGIVTRCWSEQHAPVKVDIVNPEPAAATAEPHEKAPGQSAPTEPASKP